MEWEEGEGDVMFFHLGVSCEDQYIVWAVKYKPKPQKKEKRKKITSGQTKRGAGVYLKGHVKRGSRSSNSLFDNSGYVARIWTTFGER